MIQEDNIISSIASRAVRGGIYPDGYEMDAEMDISTVHLCCPLRLGDLLAADVFDFAHDMVGIRDRLNRQTCNLEHFFLPRFAQPKG